MSVINSKFRNKFNNKQIRKALQIVQTFETECEMRKSEMVTQYVSKLANLNISSNLVYVENEKTESSVSLTEMKRVYNSHSDEFALKSF